MLLSRRPSLSQQPAGSHVVITIGRGMESAGEEAAGAVGEGAGGAAVMVGGRTTCGSSGAPDRTGLPWLRPRQASAANRRADATRWARAAPSVFSCTRCSSASSAALHSGDFRGSTPCAYTMFEANSSRAKPAMKRAHMALGVDANPSVLAASSDPLAMASRRNTSPTERFSRGAGQEILAKR